MTKKHFGFLPLVGILVAGIAGIVAASFLPATFLPATSAHDGKSDAAVNAPPAAAVRMVTDEYFGVKVPDPYRYFEDLTNPEVAAWFKGQDAYTRGVLAEIPGRAALLARIAELDSGEPAVVTSVGRLPNQRYFYEKRLASEDVFTLYVRDGLNGADRLLVDPAKFATAGGPHYVISYYSPSFDGRLVVVGISAAGSEDAVLHVFDTSTGKETGDVIDRAQFGGGAWLPDGHSFLYNRLQKMEANSAPTDRYLNSRVYLHVLGTSPEQDKLIFGAGVPGLKIDAADIPFASTDPGTPYVIGIIAHGVRNEVTAYAAPLASLDNATIPWKLFCDVDDDITGFDVHGEDLYLISHQHASRFKVLHTKLTNPDVAHAEVLVPPSEAVVQNVAAASDALYVQELNGGPGKLLRVAYDGGKPEEIALPFEGSVGLTATDQRLPGTLVELTSWTKANRIYAYDPARKTVTDTKLQPAGKFDDAGDLESKEVKVKSYDGTLVPLSIVYKKGVKLDGTNPTLLQGYGAYGITEDPSFDPRRIAWFERGGVLAVAHVRGGGEYGEEWHKAGYKLTKPNTWRDVIACGQYLIDQKYTSPAHLGVEGGSAGGITVGRTITERPEMFAAATPEVGVMNPLRAETYANGIPNIPEFGSTKTQEGFE